jgi:hypothetical protein
MSEQYSEYPEDEPIIGASYVPHPTVPPRHDDTYIGSDPAIGAAPGIGYAAPGTALQQDPDWDEGYGEYDDEFDDYDEYEYEYDYGDTDPARQPMFYVFLGLAAVVGGIVVFLLFSLLTGGGDNGLFGGADFAVQIDSPPADKRVEIGQAEEVVIQATATEPIVLIELFQGTRLLDSQEVTETPSDNRYRATLSLLFDEKGTFEVFVRVTSSSGATKDSSKVRLIAVEPVGERPQTISGRVVADTTLRAGPGSDFPEVGQLQAGDQVTILGKSADLNWLLVQTNGQQQGRWARRAAIDPLDTLDLVPVRDVTPTPGPTATPTPEVSPTPTESPSPSPDSPDFVPTNATLTGGGGTLRVTVANQSNNPYSGPLVIAISGETLQSQELVVSAEMAANGGTVVVEFTLNPPVTTDGARVVVEVDPQNAVRELREDNNAATFVLLAPEESPNITIQQPLLEPNSVIVTIRNTGGSLATTNVTVRVVFGQSINSQAQNISLSSGETATFTVARPPGQGDAIAEVVIAGQVVASAAFQLTP